jgi:putative sterol carrier protein
MEVFYGFESLSEENVEFREELNALKSSVVQTTLNDPDLKYWVKFGDGKFKCGKGVIEGPTINITCPQNVMSDILAGETTAFSEFLQGNLKLEGDLQYAVVYFDLLGLAAEINNEEALLYNE